MTFKHPELLWGLLTMAIPVLVHLINLRKFVPVKFSNVALIKAVLSQSSRLSKIKHWLALTLRMSILACIVISFAQPQRYIVEDSTDTQLVIYLDNSFSMQARADQGELLRYATQHLLENLPQGYPMTLFTNDETFPNYNATRLEKVLSKIDYCGQSFDFKDVITKSQTLFSNKTSLPKKLIILSDLKNFGAIDNAKLDFDVLVVPLVGNDNNISVLGAELKAQNIKASTIKVTLKSHFKKGNIPVALYSQGTLISKIEAKIDNYNGDVDFTFPTGEIKKGIVKIRDQGLEFDNSLYFSIQNPKPLKILSIDQSDNAFLKKIYKENFNYTSMADKNIDYGIINFQDLIILNQLDDIPSNLEVALHNFINEGKHLVVIPGKNADILQYNSLLRNRAHFKNEHAHDLKISRINFSHPLYKDVFTEKFTNFVYPTVKNSFRITSQKLSTVLTFENGYPFLISNKEISLFAAPIDRDNSNFKGSPLIVPTLYNMSKQSFLHPTIYYTIGWDNAFDVEADLSSDRVLEIADDKTNFIPLQQKIGDRVRLFTGEQPSLSGHYSIIKGKDTTPISEISYNYDREESFGKASPIGRDINVLDHIDSVTSELGGIGHEDTLWWWFVVLTLVFALLEMLILKKT